MSKTMTSAVAAKTLVTQNSEPCLVVKVTWPSSGVEYYTDGDVSQSGVTARILSCSDITTKVIDRKSANAGTVTVTLIDTDQDLWTKLRSESLTNALVSVHQFWMGLTWVTDFVKLYEGVAASPITYDEIARTLTFDIIPPIKIQQIPFAPTDDQVTSTNDAHKNTEHKFRGKPWPTPFGAVIDVPAQMVAEGPRVRTLQTIYQFTTSFVVQTDPDGDNNPFPLGQSINILVDDEAMIGSFGTGGGQYTFTPTTRNAIVNANITSALRPNVAVDPDAARGDVVYINLINGILPNVVGTWWTVTGPQQFTNAGPRFCIKQLGTKCYFLSAWNRTGAVPWLVGGAADNGTTTTFATRRYSQATGTAWQIGAGAVVTLLTQRARVYVASDVPCGNVSNFRRIRAYRRVPVGQNTTTTDNVRLLCTVPTDRYTVNTSNVLYKHLDAKGNYRNPLTVTFDPPLDQRDEGWEDDVIYCSMTTNQNGTGSGNRNTESQISYILDRFTNLTWDSATAAALNTALANYPSDFAILQQQDALQACIDIAWQARCALFVRGNDVFSKYLSIAEPSGSDGAITLSDAYVLIDEGSSLEETAFEDRVTVFVATYTLNYTTQIPRRLIKRVNDTVLGEKIEEFAFSIYQNETLLGYSAEWWSQRYGRVWKILKIRCPLPALTFDTFDHCAVNMSAILGPTSQALKCVMQSIKHDSLNHVLDLEILTPVEAGTNATSGHFWNQVPTPSSTVTANPVTPLGVGVTDDILAISKTSDGS